MNKTINSMQQLSACSRPSAQRLTIGVDLGDRKSLLCVLDGGGSIVAETSIPTTPASFHRHFASLPPALVALEVGTHSRWASRLLRECGHDVVVANPCKVKLIYANDGKNDRVDARSLARLARVDRNLLCPVQHRSEEAQAALSVLRARDAVVRARTRLINCVRGLVKPTGVRLRPASAECFTERVRENIPPQLRNATALVLGEIDSTSETIHVYDQYIEHLAATKYPQTRLLRQVPGVGALTALAFVLTLDDPSKFANSRQVGCFVGLRPKQDQSGESNPQLGISKGGDEFLRRLLVNAAHHILGPFGPDSDLRRWGLQIAQRGGKRAKKCAVAAVARKLAVLLHRLWVTGEVYEPLRNNVRKASSAA